MAHTPGPWTLRDEFEDHRICARGEVVSGTIATVRTGWPHAYQIVEQKDNARLILAAPDMIEALLAAEQILRRSPNISTNDSGNFRYGKGGVSTFSALAEVRAAIAKAVPNDN